MTDEKKMEQIQRAFEESKRFKSPIIEYNFKELPKHKKITETSFFGVHSQFNKHAPTNTARIIWNY